MFASCWPFRFPHSGDDLDLTEARLFLLSLAKQKRKIKLAAAVASKTFSRLPPARETHIDDSMSALSWHSHAMNGASEFGVAIML